MKDLKEGEVYIVMAVEVMKNQAAEHFGCYCVCDSRKTAQAVLDKDTEAGDIRPGGWIASHVLQTEELV